MKVKKATPELRQKVMTVIHGGRGGQFSEDGDAEIMATGLYNHFSAFSSGGQDSERPTPTMYQTPY